MGGSPSNFSQAQIDEYANVMSAGTVATPGVKDWFLGDAYTPGSGGLKQMTAALTSGDNPYGTYVLWDPGAEDSPLHRSIKALKLLENELAMYDPSGSFDSEFKLTLKTLKKETLEDNESLLAAIRARKSNELLAATARLNSRFTAFNTVNSSARLIYIALLEADKERQLDEVEARLNNENLKLVFDAVRTRLDSERIKLATMVQFVQQTVTVADFYIKTKIQHDNNALKMEVEDLLWDQKAQLNYAKGVSALNGAAVIPDSPSRLLEGASTAFSGISSIIPVVAALM